MSLDRFAARKRQQGYRPPALRDGCRNCRHRGPEGIRFDNGSVAYDCGLGLFLVSAGGICDQHERRARRAPAPQPEGLP